ncbi:MAG: GDSL-type esterase/lipase family protein [Lachnospiraceae bacterium]|nr:GDSL-type esterase/lipase family protein [Lachnospiraceae bacterium]
MVFKVLLRNGSFECREETVEVRVKWFKRWSYLLMWVGMGMIYLNFVDKWQVYAEPLEQVKGWYYAAAHNGRGTLASAGSAVDGLVAESLQESQSGSLHGSQGAWENVTASSGDGVLPSDSGEEIGMEGETQEGESGEPQDVSGGPEGSGETPENTSGEPKASDVGSGEPVYMTVEDDYFSDAVFIGDSRTVGMFEYGGLEETAAFYASTGLTVYKMFDSAIVPVPGERKKITVEEALQRNTFAKIYLMIGINEMGTGTVESFLEKYREVVQHLQELQPDAIIYVQAIIKVTSERSAQGDYINNEGIEARNQGIEQMADNEKIFYLDVNPLICDETGGMEASYTFDGVHLKAKYIEIWKDYLKSHAISS